MAQAWSGMWAGSPPSPLRHFAAEPTGLAQSGAGVSSAAVSGAAVSGPATG
jgi:hypothetical protein